MTYFLSTASGSQLLHIMMASFALLLVPPQSRSLAVIFPLIPVCMYLIATLWFSPEHSPMLLPANVLQVLFILTSVSVFALVMLFFSLYYREVLHTEKMLDEQYRRSEHLLMNVLPAEVAARLKVDPQAIAEQYPSATVLFADIVGFTHLASTITPQKLVAVLNELFSRFDELVDRHGLEKIKTIGDAYMVAGGIPRPLPDHTRAMADFALDLLQVVHQRPADETPLRVRVGFHTGPVVAGVIGTKKYNYDIWGDAVNIASRLEAHSAIGKIHVSEQVYLQLKNHYAFEPRETLTMKGLAPMQTYFLIGKLASV